MDELDTLAQTKMTKEVSPEAKKLANNLMGRMMVAAEQNEDAILLDIFIKYRDFLTKMMSWFYQTKLDEGKMEV